MKPLISVIIPVYNTKDYLDQCLGSIQRQTLRDIEVIIIDDGSNDGSEKICDEYGKRDNRFHILHQKNAGLAAARNIGIEQSRADYIMWADSDDWVEPTFCEEALKAVTENRADIVVFRYILQTNRGPEETKPFPKVGIIIKEKAMTEYWPIITPIVWNKLYRRNLFKNVQYPEGHTYEDHATTYRVFQAAERICLNNQCLYNYRNERKGSISNQQTPEILQDAYHYRITRLNELKAWGYDIGQEEVKEAVTYLAVMGRKAEFSDQCDRALRKGKQKAVNASRKQEAMIRLYRFSPLLFDLISVLSGRRR